MVLTSMLETIHRSRMTMFLENQFEGLLKLLFDPNIIIKKSASRLILKITEVFPKLFDKSMLTYFIPSLINSLNAPNYVAINVCFCIVNLAKNLGDKNTIKNNSNNYIFNNLSKDPMSTYFESLFKELFNVAYREGSHDFDHNLFTACFVAINHLIEYSSHDKQDKMEEILVYLLGLFDSSVKSSTSDSNKLKDQQASISLSMHFAINKYLKTLNFDLAKKIFESFLESFSQRKIVFEEAILAISSIAMSMIEFI